MATQQVFLEEFIKFVLLDQGHGVDLCTEGLGSQCEFDRVIPLLSLWQLIEGFLFLFIYLFIYFIKFIVREGRPYDVLHIQ